MCHSDLVMQHHNRGMCTTKLSDQAYLHFLAFLSNLPRSHCLIKVLQPIICRSLGKVNTRI